MRDVTAGMLQGGWHGEPDAINPPGDIDPARTVVIIGFDYGSDADVVLDYRNSFDQPEVLCGHWNLQKERRAADEKYPYV